MSESDFTLVLKSVAQGEHQSSDALMPQIYEELRKLAQLYMARESGDHTLQATALVHEAWLRMVGEGDRTWQNRAGFFSAAATAMRRILVEHARGKSRVKRGGNPIRLNIDEIDLADSAKGEYILLVDEALERLEKVNPQWAKIVVLKFFGGMTNKETAETLGIGESSVERYWAGAKAWLYKQMRSHE